MKDWRMNYYVSDKWQATRMLTLTLGIRYDYQDEVPQTKNAYAPRLGMALAPSDKLLIRAGAGKFYQYQSTAIPANLFAGAVNAPVFTFDTGQDNNPAAGRLPTRDVCLLPVNNGGQAQGSPGRRAPLAGGRRRVGATALRHARMWRGCGPWPPRPPGTPPGGCARAPPACHICGPTTSGSSAKSSR